MKKNNELTNTDLIRYAFRKSLPVLFGYVFLGIAFGILLEEAGYNFVWAFAISLFVFAGSMQFVLVSLLKEGASLLITALMTLFINSRHIFYGLSFVESFRKMERYYPYMIFSLTDETYSVLYSCRDDEEGQQQDHKAWFYIALLHQCYWILGSVIGALAGNLIPLDFTGIDFSMTALFVVILIDQIRGSKVYFPAATGAVCATLCLVIFGGDNFLLPALLTTAFTLFLKNSLNNSAKGSD